MTDNSKYSIKELLALIKYYNSTGKKDLYTSSKWVTKKTLLELFSKHKHIYFASNPITVLAGKNKVKRTIYHIAWK
jgi:hypothetical protein